MDHYLYRELHCAVALYDLRRPAIIQTLAETPAISGRRFHFY
jgi:hypothetical protein